MELITVLRKATSYDCEAIYNAHLFAVRYACKNCYSDEILQVWSRLLYPESYLEGIKHKELWVAEYKHKIQGFLPCCSIAALRRANSSLSTRRLI